MSRAVSTGVSPARRRTVTRGHVTLAVTEVGDESHPALVVAHGAGSSARFALAAFAAPAVAHGRRLVAYDLRGHGDSTPVRDSAGHHLDEHARDLAAVVRDTAGVVEVAGGISIGGHAAVRAATRGMIRPDAVLACLPAWTGSAEPGRGPHAGIAAEVRSTGIGAMIERLAADTVMPEWLRATLVTDYRRHDERSLEAALLALDGADAPTLDELAGLAFPLAVIGWSDDPGHPLEVARRWVSSAPVATFGQLRLHDLEADVAALGRSAMVTVAARPGRGGGRQPGPSPLA